MSDIDTIVKLLKHLDSKFSCLIPLLSGISDCCVFGLTELSPPVDAPAIGGQSVLFNVTTGVLYYWDGDSWETAGGSLPYKVYTALLTETPPSTATSGTLIIGETYTIGTYVSGDDFANVADVQSGTINTDNCVFIATGTTPTDWSNGSSLDNHGNPIATVLQNTIGDIVWTHAGGAGAYEGTLNGAFTENKTWAYSGVDLWWDANVNEASLQWNDVNTVRLVTKDSSGSQADGFTLLSVEIRVYL